MIRLMMFMIWFIYERYFYKFYTHPKVETLKSKLATAVRMKNVSQFLLQAFILLSDNSN